MTIDEEIQNLIERANKLADRLDTKRGFEGPSEELRETILKLEEIQEEIEDLGDRDDEADLPDDAGN